MGVTKWLADGIVSEFDGVQLGDKRLEKRLSQVAETLDSNPSASFPSTFHSAAELEGFYRFLRNEAVQSDNVLSSHVKATVARTRACQEVVAIHDTTQFNFTGKRDGLGLTNTSTSGFFLHTSLLMSTHDSPVPLGVGAVYSFTRDRIKSHRKRPQQQQDKQNEGLRWLEGIEKVERAVERPGHVIHVADRECDSYDVLASCLQSRHRFVIRGRRNRILVEKGKKVHLTTVVADLKPQLRRKVQIAGRGKQVGRRSESLPSREGRSATLAVAAKTIEMSAPLSYAEGRTESLEMNVIRVWELDPPRGEEAVEWFLWTTEDISSKESLSKIVDIYRTRWVIEEFFKALKTGCQFERRQLESLDTLSVACSLFMPVAWRMLLARSLARAPNSPPAHRAFTELELEVLQSQYGEVTSAQEALLAVAKLGGHLTQNGSPGWITISRGFEKLASFVAMFQKLARQRCDQS